LSCAELSEKFDNLQDEYEAEEQVCKDTSDRFTTLATTDGCDYGVTCARCDNLANGVDTLPSQASFRPDTVAIRSQDAITRGLESDSNPVVGPQGTEMYISNFNEIWVEDPPYYRRTCVEYKPVADQYCTDSQTYCTGGNVVGTLAAIEEQVIIAMSQGDSSHPECPSGCQSLSDDVKSHFIKMAVPDYENVCVYNGLYYYKDPTDRERKFTCVAAGERLAVCPAEKYLCVGFDDNTGMKTYGFYDWQAAAVKTALSLNSRVHPYCPSYQNV